MKKAHIKIYLRKNLGDDLFLKIILERYPNTFFKCIATSRYNIKYRNLKLYSRLYNKIITLLTNDRIKLYSELNKKSDIFINLGGSVFMDTNQSRKELTNELEKLYFKHNKPYYIIGSNFGPYYNDYYRRIYSKVFKKANDVCFRDKYSYNLFSKTDIVRYEPDIVFSLDISKYEIKNDNTVVISVIDLENRKGLKNKLEEYENKIVEICNKFIKNNKKIILMSFCSSEGDEKAINRIYKKCNSKMVLKHFYRGDIDRSLNVLASAELIFATRFHASILGLLFNKTIVPIIYSAKTLNVLEDMNFLGKTIDIKNIEKFDIEELKDSDLLYKLNVKKEIEKSSNQFKELDKILE